MDKSKAAVDRQVGPPTTASAGAGQAIREAGAVVDVGGEPGVRRQVGGEAGIHGVV